MAGGQERILRRRIRSVQSTKKITRAMELIAASRIVKAQARVHAAQPYSDKITEVVQDLAAAGAGTDSPLLVPRPEIHRVGAHRVHRRPRPVRRLQLVGPARRRGLDARAGRPRARLRARRGRAQGRELLPVPELPHRRRASPGSPTARPTRTRAAIAAAVEPPFLAGDVDMVELVYTRFVSAGFQEVVRRPLMPLDRETLGPKATGTRRGRVRRRRARRRATTRRAPTTSSNPSPTEILERLLPRYAEARVYAALLNAAASEHAARQRAMKAATDNADELITTLDARHEPRPPGLHHHRDHGDRRRRRGAAPSPTRRPPTLRSTSSSARPQPRPSPTATTEPQEHRMTITAEPQRPSAREPRAQGRPRRRDRRTGRRRRVPARRAARDQLRARDGRRARGRDDHDRRRGRAADRRGPLPGHLHEADRRPAARHPRPQPRSRHHDAGRRRRARPRVQRHRRAARHPRRGRSPRASTTTGRSTATSPPFDQLEPKAQMFETGIKVIDLLEPYVAGRQDRPVRRRRASARPC